MVNYKYIYNIFYNILHLLVPYHLVLDNEVCFNYRRNYCNYQCVLCTIPSRIHRDGNPVMYCFSGCQHAVINQLLLVAYKFLEIALAVLLSLVVQFCQTNFNDFECNVKFVIRDISSIT